MKKTILLLFIAIAFYNNTDCQITKGNWMVGGNGSFVFESQSVFNGSNPIGKTNSTQLNLAPDIGYFFIDKFAGGIRLSFNRNHIKFNSPAGGDNFTTFGTYGIGPFVRYYFLNTGMQYNILAEGSYLFLAGKTETSNSTYNNTSNIISFSAGPVIYFNTSVGIEFLLNYFSVGGNDGGSNTRSNSFGAGIGLQIHLEREKD